MKIKTRWWWIRHAPVVNPEKKLYGQLDLDVDLSNREKLADLADRLPDSAVWITTSLQRARETANTNGH
jgi:alpha-ribazole phosphatase